MLWCGFGDLNVLGLGEGGVFINDVYKYTEKIERKNFTSEKKVQTLTFTDKS